MPIDEEFRMIHVGRKKLNKQMTTAFLHMLVVLTSHCTTDREDEVEAELQDAGLEPVPEPHHVQVVLGHVRLL